MTNSRKILLNLSLLKSELSLEELRKDYKVSDDESLKFSGIQTNEAPVKFIINLAQKEHCKISEIICVVTKEAKDNGYEHFNKEIETFCIDEGFEMPEITVIDDNGSIENHPILTEIFSHLKSNDHVYIDYTGGKRHNVNLLTVAIRMMKAASIHCDGVVYADPTAKTPVLINITETFRLFDLLNGVHEFTNYGNADALCEYLELMHCHPDDTVIINNFKEHLGSFSDDIKLCRLDRLIDTLNNINNDLSKIDKSNSSSLVMVLLKPLTETIRKDLNLKSDKSIDYLSLVRWCAKNDMIQLSTSIMIEKIPLFIAETNVLIVLENDLKITLEKENDNLSTSIYKLLFVKYFTNKENQKEKSVSFKISEETINQITERLFEAIEKNKSSHKMNGGCQCNLGDRAANNLLNRIIEIGNDFYKIKPSDMDSKAKNFTEVLNKFDSEFLNNCSGTYNSVKTRTDFFEIIVNDKKAIAYLFNKYNTNKNDNSDIVKKIETVESIPKNEYSGVTFNCNKKLFSNFLKWYLFWKENRNNICHVNDLLSPAIKEKKSSTISLKETYKLDDINEILLNQINLASYKKYLDISCDLIEKLIKTKA